MSTPAELKTERLAAEQHERHESMTDIMASWALEGMLPTPETLAHIRSYVDGEITLEEYIAQTKARYAPRA
jgi:hypothetical protein